MKRLFCTLVLLLPAIVLADDVTITSFTGQYDEQGEKIYRAGTGVVIGQTNNGHRGQAARDVDFYFDRRAIETHHGATGNFC